MADINLSTIVGAGGGSVSNFPPRPAPLNDEGYISTEGNRIPHKGTLIDNIKLPTGFSNTATGSYSGMLGESTVWTVNSGDINAASDAFLHVVSCWYDSVNDRLYVFGIDIGTTPATLYTGYITLETGAVTSVGGVQLGTDPTSPSSNFLLAVSRPSIDSGNFTLIFNDRTVVINESTGAEISNVASTNTTNSLDVGTYATLDGTITLDHIRQGTATDQDARLTRNKLSNLIPLPESNLLSTVTASSQRGVSWGDKVKIFQESSGLGKSILRTFNRSEFDNWLQEVADYGGLA